MKLKKNLQIIINNIQDNNEKIMRKENKSKNAFQNDDPDESDINSMKNVKLTKNIKDEDRNITKKYIFYLM